MADVDSITNGLIAASLGCEWVGTTLYGYTEQTAQQNPPGYGLISPLREQLPDQVTLICEGGIKSPDSALQALEHGADLVVVGTAITGVDLQVADYLRALRRQSGGVSQNSGMLLKFGFPVALSGTFFRLPIAGLPMAELQALNRELRRVCSQPPREAVSVCRIHSRLVGSL